MIVCDVCGKHLKRQTDRSFTPRTHVEIGLRCEREVQVYLDPELTGGFEDLCIECHGRYTTAYNEMLGQLKGLTQEHLDNTMGEWIAQARKK